MKNIPLIITIMLILALIVKIAIDQKQYTDLKLQVDEARRTVKMVPVNDPANRTDVMVAYKHGWNRGYLAGGENITPKIQWMVDSTKFDAIFFTK